MAGQRIRKMLDREPIWRKAEERIEETIQPHTLRNRPGSRLRQRVPKIPNRNLGGGVTVGTIEAAVAVILEETVGVPFGSDVEVVNTESVNGGTRYIVNVDAPFENMARARAFFESTTGFTSLLTDMIDVNSVETLKTRVFRDTYQIKILVKD